MKHTHKLPHTRPKTCFNLKKEPLSFIWCTFSLFNNTIYSVAVDRRGKIETPSEAKPELKMAHIYMSCQDINQNYINKQT